MPEQQNAPWNEWHFAEVRIRIRESGKSVVVAVMADDGSGCTFEASVVPNKVKRKILEAVNTKFSGDA